MKLLSIQSARGVAAFLVVLYHGGRMLSLPQYLGANPLHNAFNFGHSRVDFFFVLSGFIIYYVHHRHIGSPDRLMAYLWKRVMRIYPIYWVISLSLLVLLLTWVRIPTISNSASN